MMFCQANTVEAEKDKGVQDVCKRVIIMMESRMGRERNEVMRRVIEKRWRVPGMQIEVLGIGDLEG